MRVDDLSLGELRDLAESAVLVAAASEAGIFEALAGGSVSPRDVARRLGTDLRATDIVLSALVATGLVEEVDGGRYRVSERGRKELGEPDGEGYLGRGLPHWLRRLRSMTRLAEVLERGGPLEKRAARRESANVARFVRAMTGMPAERITKIVDVCLARCPDARSVLDLGGGPGHVTRGFVERGLRGTLVDMPDVTEHAVAEHRLDEVAGLTVAAVDFTRNPLPQGPFDIVIMANVLHIYGPEENAALLRRVAEVTTRGGVVAIVGAFRGLSRTAAYVGLRMLLKSERGDAYAVEEIQRWMEAAGFRDPRVVALDEERHVVTAVR